MILRPLIQESITEEGLPALAGRIAALMSQQKPFVLWLEGPMGAGKSTLTRHILWALGLDPRIPVVSPTYTLMNEYEINGEWFAHLDFYRADQFFSMDELGLEGVRSYAGVFIEWPQAPHSSQQLPPTLRMTITPSSDGLSREYRLSSEKPVAATI